MWKKLFEHLERDFGKNDNQLSKITDVPAMTIGNIRRGIVMEPHNDTIEKIESGLGIQIDRNKFTYIKLRKNDKHLLPVINETKIREISMNQIRENAVRFREVAFADSNTNFLILLERDFLYPSYRKGDMLLADLNENVVEGNLVIAETMKGILMGRIHFQKDIIIISSESPEISPSVIGKSDVKKLCVIKQLIRDIL